MSSRGKFPLSLNPSFSMMFSSHGFIVKIWHWEVDTVSRALAVTTRPLDNIGQALELLSDLNWSSNEMSTTQGNYND